MEELLKIADEEIKNGGMSRRSGKDRKVAFALRRTNLRREISDGV
jgi:hypothetical protein